jgi:hypothetical protein
MCDDYVLILSSTIHKGASFHTIRQSQPDKIPANNIAIHLRQADSKGNQLFVDGSDHGTVPLAIRQLQYLVYATL